MHYGLYLSASGVQVNMHRQDVFANNLANQNTVGFKRDLADIRQRLPESQEDDFGFELRNDLLDKIGGGVFAHPSTINFSQGALQKTDESLDVALTSPTTFLAVQARTRSGETEVRLTRDGRMLVGPQNQLVLAAGGQPVLDEADQPIVVPPGSAPRIDERGRILQGNEVIGQLQVVEVTDTAKLQKAGQNLLRMDGGSDVRVPAANRSMKPGYVEASTVDPIRTLMSLISASKAVGSNAGMIKYADQLLDRAVNVLGRVG